VLLALRENAKGSPPNFGSRYGDCAAIHPKRFSCRKDALIRFYEVWKWVFPVYGALHFVPVLLFRRALFVKDPLKMLLRTLWGSSRSSAFLGAFVMICEGTFVVCLACLRYVHDLIGTYCFKHYLYENLRDLDILPTRVLNLLISKGSFAVLGFLAGLSLFVEDPRRRAELAMYVLPKGLESAWSNARGKGYVVRTGKVGEALVGGFCYLAVEFAESTSLFLPACCHRDGNGYGTRFATRNARLANHASLFSHFPLVI
jgi:hypothetical protein